MATASLAALSFAACSSTPAHVASAVVAPVLGTSQSYAVLGGSTVTNTGSTTVVGNLGVSPGTAVTGFPPGIVEGGTTHAADAAALQAQADLTTAYDAAKGQACNVDLTGQDLGGLTLTPGVYCYSSSAQLTGALVLDAQGRSDAVFVFQVASTLTTASNASVRVVNGAGQCNVFWQVGSSATLGTGTALAGNILALTSITLDTGASVAGRALARNGAVTMDDNRIAIDDCAAPPTDGGVSATDLAVGPTDLAVGASDLAVAKVDAAAAIPDLGTGGSNDLSVCAPVDMAIPVTPPDLSCQP